MFSIVNRNNTQVKPPQIQMQMQMQNRRVMSMNPRSNALVQKPKTFSPSDGDRIKWGRPTWRFFHILAHKIKPEHFKQVRKDMLDTIYSICCTLPCPVCSEHAKQYMNAINFNTIQTKEDLKDMLFNFHNAVNVRKNYAPFAREELDATYNEFNTIAVAREFMFYYKDRQRSIKLVADDMMRTKIAVNVQNWFNSVHQFMDL